VRKILNKKALRPEASIGRRVKGGGVGPGQERKTFKAGLGFIEANRVCHSNHASRWGC